MNLPLHAAMAFCYYNLEDYIWLFSAVKKLPDDNSQTPIIPSGIYSKFIQNGAELFEEYLEVRESIEAWFEKVAENKNYGLINSRARKGNEKIKS